MNDQPITYPWAGKPRTFRAVAMPNGDARHGVSGELVLLVEQREGAQDRPRFLTRAEAEQLRDELDAGLRAFDLAKDFAKGVVAQVGQRASSSEAVGPEYAKACRAPYPFRDHRTLAEVEAAADSASEAA